MSIVDLSPLIEELSKVGVVEVIKNEYVFTLLMFKDSEFLDKSLIPLKVLEVVTGFLGNQKPNIEVMKNDSNFLLLILKP